MKKLIMLEISMEEAQGKDANDKADWMVATAISEGASCVRITDDWGLMKPVADLAQHKIKSAGIAVL